MVQSNLYVVMIVQSVILYGGDSTLSQPLSGYMVLQSTSVWCDSTVSQDLSVVIYSQPQCGVVVNLCMVVIVQSVNLYLVMIVQSTSMWW